MRVVAFALACALGICANSDERPLPTNAEEYLNEAEFKNACHRHGLPISVLPMEPDTLSNTRQFANQVDKLLDRAFLGASLYFPAWSNQLPASVEITKPHVKEGQGFLYRSVNDGGTGEEHHALQLSSTPGNDDIEIRLSSKVYHTGSSYQLVYAAGVVVCRDIRTHGETVKFYSAANELITTVKDIPRGSEHTDVLFALKDADLLQGVSDTMTTVFWVAFNILIVAMLAVDMLLGNKRSVDLSEALTWSAVWISVAMVFGFGVFLTRGRGPAVVWLTSYLLEKFLSVDNLFVFVTIFTNFKTPTHLQHRVLTWGIIGAIGLRAIFIFGGVLLVHQFSWVLSLFGVFLIYAGVKAMQEAFEGNESSLTFENEQQDAALPTMAGGSEQQQQQDNFVLNLLGSIMPISKRYDPKGRFFVREDEDKSTMTVPKARESSTVGKLVAPLQSVLSRCVELAGLKGYKATPLVAVLLIVESTDMIFAADSIPAVLSITQDSFIAYTSNIFAVLGLRALYFALAAAMAEFEYLGPGLGVILFFIGAKLLLVLVDVHVGVEMTLIVVLGVLAIAIGLSWLRPSKSKDQRERLTSSGSVSDSMFDE
eukprot:TRINITY_DN11648_c0_g2_i3.p2 TRINITY_DN11648_c0_g2~~TRINITY_DN11648_c0_g2_i3.p2  ORF type:complete len:596 (+),score=152.02 TRINITY_DN11648_c0_g2_i3:2025-3812(+)